MDSPHRLIGLETESESHPLHPATVHFPIAFLSLSYFFDILYGLSTHPSTASLARLAFDFTPFLGDMARLSHYLNILGLLTAVPAAATGGMELMAMIQRQDLVNKLQKSQNKSAAAQRMHPKLKIGFLHAALNDLAIVGSGYNWWTRRAAIGNVPANINIALSSVLMFSIFFSAYLGGQMVYKYGVGVQRQSEAKKMQ